MTETNTSMLLWQRIAGAASAQPDLDVLTFEHKGEVETRTYRQLRDNAWRLAQALQAQGIKPGDSFALLMANHPVFVEAMIAASLTGGVFVPIDPRARGDKLAFMLDRAKCHGVIASSEALATLQAVRRGRPALRWVIGFETGESPRTASDWDGVLPLSGLMQQPVPQESALSFVAQDPLAPWQILFTSGTTGDPKGIVMHQRRYVENALATRALCGYTPEDRPYTGLSFTHANAQVLTLGSCLIQGMRGVFSRRFTKSRLWDIARTHGCTTFNLLGGMTTAIYAESPRADDADNPVRFVLSAGMPSAIWADFERRFDLKVLEFYGAAEGGLTFNPVAVGPVGSIGRPVPSLKHRIVDDEGRDVASDARGERVGELLFQPADGTPMQVDYLDDPTASAKKSRDGWLWMGDIVREDAQGWLYFMHRKGGSIRRNGEFIDPAPIEKLIAEDPLVDDVYVYGVPAATGVPGEKDIVVAIVPTARHGFEPQRLFARCRQRLESNSVPSFVQVLAEIPKTASEKPQERFLLEHFAAHPDCVYDERVGSAVG